MRRPMPPAAMGKDGKASRALIRRVQRALAPPTGVEAARKALALKALSYAINNRGATVRDVVAHLESLIAQTADLKLAAETLQADLFRVELRRLARKEIAEAPGARRGMRQLKEAIKNRGPLRSSG
jgi:hypothetical protein